MNRILKIALGLIILISRSLYNITLFLLTTFRENVTIVLAILTGAYVLLTLNIVRESKRQTDIMIENTRYVQRAFFYIDVKWIVHNWNLRQNTDIKGAADEHIEEDKMKGTTNGQLPSGLLYNEVTIRLQNEGMTPGFPIMLITVFDTLHLRFSVRDSLLRGNLSSSPLFRGYQVMPIIIGPKHEHQTSEVFLSNIPKERDLNQSRSIYLHIYYVYRDIFDQYHDLYFKTTYSLSCDRKEIGWLPPVISIHTFNEKERGILEHFVDSKMWEEF